MGITTCHAIIIIIPLSSHAITTHSVTLIGSIQEVDEATAAEAAAAHSARFYNAMGVDAPSEHDLFFRLTIDKAFYVGGMGSQVQAEVISAAQFTEYVVYFLSYSFILGWGEDILCINHMCHYLCFP